MPPNKRVPDDVLDIKFDTVVAVQPLSQVAADDDVLQLDVRPQSLLGKESQE